MFGLSQEVVNTLTPCPAMSRLAVILSRLAVSRVAELSRNGVSWNVALSKFKKFKKIKKNHRKIHVVHRNFQKNPRTITKKSKKFHQEIQKLPPFHQSQYGLGHPAWHCCKCKYHVPNKYDFTSGEILPPN